MPESIALDQTFLADGVTFSMLITARLGDSILLDGEEHIVTHVEETQDIHTHERDTGETTCLGLRMGLEQDEKSRTLELTTDSELYIRDSAGSLCDAPQSVRIPDPHHRAMYAKRREFHMVPDEVIARETHSALDQLRGIGTARQYLGSSTKRNGTAVRDFFEVEVTQGPPVSSTLLSVAESHGLKIEAIVDGAGEFGGEMADGYTVLLTFS